MRTSNCKIFLLFLFLGFNINSYSENTIDNIGCSLNEDNIAAVFKCYKRTGNSTLSGIFSYYVPIDECQSFK